MKKLFYNVIILMICVFMLAGCKKSSIYGTFSGEVKWQPDYSVVMQINKDGSITRHEHYEVLDWDNVQNKEKIVDRDYQYAGKWRKLSDDQIRATFDDTCVGAPFIITLSSDGSYITVKSEVPYYQFYNYIEYLDRR